MCTLIVLAACVAAGGEPLPVPAGEELAKAEKKIGRASCRERV